MSDRCISLCMIVKDEENYISDCLASVKDYVDEMIIVDTGSTDHTVEICQALGAQVYHFPWNGNFADSRNYSIERAAGDWILWLDADERIDAADAAKLRDILNYDDLLLSLHFINYYGETPNPDNTYEIAITRLFRNHLGFKFMNKIHESLNLKEILSENNSFSSPRVLPIKVHHYGYLDHVNKEKNKSRRNICMLEEELRKKDCSPWTSYHLASEYYNLKEYGKAMEYINRSIMGFLMESKIPPSLIYQLKYLTYISSDNIEAAWPGIEKAIELYPDYVNLHFYKGLILYTKGLYAEALEVFNHCLEIGEDNLDHLILKGLGSHQALYYKGCCQEKLGLPK